MMTSMYIVANSSMRLMDIWFDPSINWKYASTRSHTRVSACTWLYLSVWLTFQPPTPDPMSAAKHMHIRNYAKTRDLATFIPHVREIAAEFDAALEPIYTSITETKLETPVMSSCTSTLCDIIASIEKRSIECGDLDAVVTQSITTAHNCAQIVYETWRRSHLDVDSTSYASEPVSRADRIMSATLRGACYTDRLIFIAQSSGTAFTRAALLVGDALICTLEWAAAFMRIHTHPPACPMPPAWATTFATSTQASLVDQIECCSFPAEEFLYDLPAVVKFVERARSSELDALASNSILARSASP